MTVPTFPLSKPVSRALSWAVLSLLLLALCYIFHANSPALWGVDAYFHIKYSQILRTQGLIQNFPWLAFTIYTNDFADDHFLFHLFLVPFTFGNLITGAKVYASLVTISVFLFFFWLLQRHQIRHPFLWTLGLLFSSPIFFTRLSMARPSGLSLLFLLIGTALILEHKDRWLAPLAFLYVWLYGGFPLLLILVCIACGVSWAFTRKIRSGLFIACGLGTLAGLVLHPYFPNNIQFLYTSYTQIELGTFADPVLAGSEDYPYAASTAVRHTLLVWIILFLTLLVYLLQPKTLTPQSLLLFLFSIVLLCLYLKVRRFIEYWPPFALLFTAWALNPVARSLDLRKQKYGAIVFSLVLSVAAYHTYTRLFIDNTISNRPQAYRAAAQFLKENTAKNDIVFTADWDDFPHLFHYNDHNRYIVGLGLHYLYLYDPNLYAIWLHLSRGLHPTPALTILDTFGAHYVFSLKADTDFLEAFQKSEHIEMIYDDPKAQTYRIHPP